MRIKSKLILLLAVAGVCFSAYQMQASAATGVIYISPSSTSVQKGSSTTVALRINPGTSVDSVQATVTYNTSQLQFVSLALGFFSTCVQDSGGSGSVVFSCTKLSGSTSSDTLIADITFKALVGSGSDSLGVTNANAARSGSYTYPSSSGATVQFTSPSSQTPSSPSSSSSSSSSGSAGYNYYYPSTSTATPAATPKKPAKAVTVTAKTTKVQYGSANIEVYTNMPVQSFIQYGTDKNNLGTKTPLSGSGKSAAITLTSLTPGTVYYYQAVTKATDAAKLSESSVQSFTTKGFTVQVAVLDSKYRPLADKTVTLHSTPMEATTNSSGIATFTNVAPGLHHVEYTINAHTYTKQVYVTDTFTASKDGTQSANPQSVAVVLAGYTQPQTTSGSSSGQFMAILAIVVVIGAAVLVVARKKILAYVKRPAPVLVGQRVKLHHSA